MKAYFEGNWKDDYLHGFGIEKWYVFEKLIQLGEMAIDMKDSISRVKNISKGNISGVTIVALKDNGNLI